MTKTEKPALSQTLIRWTAQTFFWGLIACWIAIVESKSYFGAVAFMGEDAGKPMGALSLIFATLGFAAAALGSHFKNDVRPHVAQWAKNTRRAAIAFLALPTFFLAYALNWDGIDRKWAAYEGSPAYQADQRTLADPMADRYDRDTARERLTRPTSPEPDIEFIAAFFLQFLLYWASDALRVPAKATEAEIRHWRKVEAARKGAATRAKNKALREKRKAQETRPRFTIFAGGKK